jgi:hypothetical protein
LSAVPSYLILPVIVLSPGSGAGAAVGAGSGVAAGVDAGSGLGEPHAVASMSADRAIPARTRINIDLSPVLLVRQSLGEGGSVTRNETQRHIGIIAHRRRPDAPTDYAIATPLPKRRQLVQ